MLDLGVELMVIFYHWFQISLMLPFPLSGCWLVGGIFSMSLLHVNLTVNPNSDRVSHFVFISQHVAVRPLTLIILLKIPSSVSPGFLRPELHGLASFTAFSLCLIQDFISLITLTYLLQRIRGLFFSPSVSICVFSIKELDFL